MYNIDMYTYQNKPFCRSRKYGIHPLDEPGYEKYLSTESHAVNYLSRTNPKVLKHIIGTDFEAITSEQKRKLKEKLEYQQKGHAQTEGNALHSAHLNEQTKDNTTSKQMPQHYKDLHNQNDEEEYKIETANENETDLFNTNQTNFHKTHIRPLSSTMGAPRTKEIFKKPYRHRRSFKDHYGYDPKLNVKSNKDFYKNEISNLKNNSLSSGEFNYTHSGFYYPQTKYNGFTSYAVPRTQQRPTSAAFREYNKKLDRSLRCFSARNQCENDNEAMEKGNEDLKQKLPFSAVGTAALSLAEEIGCEVLYKISPISVAVGRIALSRLGNPLLPNPLYMRDADVTL